jgi:hypothetical protein
MEDKMERPAEKNVAFTRREALAIVALSLVIFLTRLPWISAGYGADQDAYRVVDAARYIARTGEYMASRLPGGNPVQEYLTAVTPAKTSPDFSNGLTAVFSCLAFLFFALILRQFHVSQYLLLASAFAFTPVVYVNSVSTMDFMFAAAFTLGSTYFVLIHRPFAAGICLGLAIGCRITSGAMLLPLTLWMFLEERTLISAKRFLIFSATGLMVGGICFLPSVQRYGLNFLIVPSYPIHPTMQWLLRKVVWEVWGGPAALGLLGLCFLVPFVFKNIRKSLIQPHVKRGLALSSLVIALYVVAFLRLPDDASYMIPVVPFVLLSVGLLIPRHFVRWFAILLFVSSFITIDRGGVTLPGPIMLDHLEREAQIQETTRIIDAVARLPENAVTIAGPYLPRIRVTLSDAPEVDQKYVYLIDDEDIYKEYAEQARVVYFVRGMDSMNLQLRGVDPKRLGAQQLDTLDEK